MSYRVLLASDFYPPFIGGAELQTQVLGQALARRGHQVSVATVWHAGLPEVEQQGELSVHRLKGAWTGVPWFSSDARRRFHPPLPDPALARGLGDLIRTFRPDVVQANGWIAYSCATALDGSSTPLVLSVRDYGYSCALRTLMHGDELCDGPAIGKCLGCAAGHYGWPKAAGAVAGVLGGRALLAQRTSAIHCVSRFVETIMRRDFLRQPMSGGLELNVHSVTIPDIVIIPEITDPNGSARPANGHTVESPPPDQHTGAVGVVDPLPAEPFILFVGALQLHKGLRPLLEAYRQLAERPPLVLIGSVWADTPPTFPERVTVLRNLPHAEVMRAWERSLFGVVPSIWPDPLPGTVREAMSKGKAVIGSATGGIVDMVAHDETGLLVQPGDVDGLREAMARLVGDAALRERLGRTARERARRFTADAVAPSFEALYAQLLSTPRVVQ